MKELATWTEKQWQRHVEQLAAYLHWTVYHTHDSRRSNAGFPDLVLARPPRLIFAELKTEKGRLRPAQSIWKALLEACPGVEYYLWRPTQLDEVKAILKR